MLYGLPVIQIIHPVPMETVRLTISMNSSLQITCQEGLIPTPTILAIYHSIQGEEDFEHDFLVTPRMFVVSKICRKKGEYAFKVENMSYSPYHGEPYYIPINPHTLIVFKKMLEIHLGDLIHVPKM